MGGKRPDQHQIDGGEGGATDYKFDRNPEDNLEHPIDQKSGQPIKPSVPSPDARNPRVEPAKDKNEQD